MDFRLTRLWVIAQRFSRRSLQLWFDVLQRNDFTHVPRWSARPTSTVIEAPSERTTLIDRDLHRGCCLHFSILLFSWMETRQFQPPKRLNSSLNNQPQTISTYKTKNNKFQKLKIKNNIAKIKILENFVWIVYLELYSIL